MTLDLTSRDPRAVAPAPHRGDAVGCPRELICPALSYGHHRLHCQAKFWQQWML
jgi:hypothetical protein